MIASLRGSVLALDEEKTVIEVGGLGYEVHMTPHSLSQLRKGAETLVWLEESTAMYGGGTTLYGFLSQNEQAMFRSFRDNVPSTGAKKALEYMDKAGKSLPDFRRAIMEKDAKLLTGVFGFTKKTAERLIDGLKDKLEGVPVSGAERLRTSPELPATSMGQALAALGALGYKPSEAKAALSAVAEENAGAALTPEQIIRQALKRL
jgi:Holliday junction DNA helicase RuvA